ncbi:hypothetical protein [Bradyrhizobium sp. USDA 4529]
MKVKAFVFVATLGYSRRLHVHAFGAEKQEHWFAGLESAFTTLDGVPEEVLMDNPRRLVVRHDAVSRSVQFNDKLITVREALGFPSSHTCAPCRARTRGKTENGVGQEECDRGAFLRELGGIRGASRRIEREVANVRIHGTTGEARSLALRATRHTG